MPPKLLPRLSHQFKTGTPLAVHRKVAVPPAKVDPTLNTATDGVVIALLDGADVVGLDFQSGPVGYYLLLNRDFTIDNFSISIAPEPTAMVLLGIGLLGMLLSRQRRRR